MKTLKRNRAAFHLKTTRYVIRPAHVIRSDSIRPAPIQAHTHSARSSSQLRQQPDEPAPEASPETQPLDVRHSRERHAVLPRHRIPPLPARPWIRSGSDARSDAKSDAPSDAFVLRILASADDESGDAFLETLADEDDLFDEYVRGELDDDSSRRFESLVLGHEFGRRRVAFARALAERARKEAERDVTAMTPTLDEDESRRPSPNDDEGESLLSRFLAGLRAPAARPAWALCLILLAFAAAQTYRVAHLRRPRRRTPGLLINLCPYRSLRSHTTPS